MSWDQRACVRIEACSCSFQGKGSVVLIAIRYVLGYMQNAYALNTWNDEILTHPSCARTPRDLMDSALNGSNMSKWVQFTVRLPKAAPDLLSTVQLCFCHLDHVLIGTGLFRVIIFNDEF